MECDVLHTGLMIPNASAASGSSTGQVTPPLGPIPRRFAPRN